jgi:uncharacterized membrane protein
MAPNLGAAMTKSDPPSQKRHAGVRVAAAAIAGLGAGLIASWLGPWQAADLIGWVLAAVVYLASVWLTVGRLDAENTERVAASEDPSIRASELVLLTAAVACLGGVGMALVKAGHVAGSTKGYLIGLGVLSVVSAWATVHTVFTLRYARLYYSGRAGGINFNERTAPAYLDFAYVAFTIGMTFQVSDTNLTSQAVRRTALRHGLLSFLFGVVIVGMTINVVASLLK